MISAGDAYIPSKRVVEREEPPQEAITGEHARGSLDERDQRGERRYTAHPTWVHLAHPFADAGRTESGYVANGRGFNEDADA